MDRLCSIKRKIRNQLNNKTVKYRNTNVGNNSDK